MIKQDILEILEYQNCLTTIRKIDNGFLVIFPRREIDPKYETFGVYYEYKDGFVNTEVMGCDKTIKKTFECQNFAQRIYIWNNIFSHCQSINYDIDMIKIIDNDNISLFDFLKRVSMTEEEQAMENILCSYMNKKINDDTVPELESIKKSIIEEQI